MKIFTSFFTTAKSKFSNCNSIIVAFLLLLGTTGSVFAQTNTFTGSGTWNTAARWSLGVIPTTAHDAVIASGATVTGMSAGAVNVCKTLTVNGVLTFSGGSPRIITVSDNVTVASTGTINMTGSNQYYIDYKGASFSVASGATLTMTSTNAEAGVRYTGTVASTITNSSASTFGSLIVSGTGVLTTGSAITFGKAITISSAGTFAASHTVTANAAVSVAGSFQLNNGGWATGAGAWSYTATTGTLIFANTGSNYTVNADVFWPATNGPYNVNISGAGGGINMTVARTVPTTGTTGTFQTVGQVTGTALTLNGTAQINAGGYFTTTPTYGAASTLVYSTGAAYGMGNEWTGNSNVAGSGVPFNVTIQTASTVLTTAAAARGCAGTVTVNASCGLTLNGTSGDLYVGGSFTQNGTFTHNSKAVFFNGTVTQTVSGSGLNSTGATNCFAYFVNNNTAAGGVVIGVNTTVDGTAGDVLQLLNTGPLTIGAFTLTVNGNGGNIRVTGASRVINFTSASGILKIVGTSGTLKTIASTSSGLLSVTSTTAGGQVQIEGGGLDCGSALTTIQTGAFLTINSGGYVANNSPTYATGSTLSFRSGAAYGVGSGDKTWGVGTSGAGVPDKVQINAAGTDVQITEDRTARTSVTVTSGTLTNNTNTLNIATTVSTGATALSIAGGTVTNGGGTINIGVANGGNQALTLSSGALTLSSGTINLNGNFARPTAGGSFTQSGGLLIIDGNSGTAASSVATGVNLFSFISATGTGLNCTAGTIRIVDPPHSSYSTSSTKAVSISYGTVAPSSYQFSGSHTFEFGDGTSTTGGNTDGFVIDTWVGTLRIPLQNVTVNSGATANRWVSTAYTSGNGTHIQGNLTINATCEFRNTLSTAQFVVNGNIANAGTFTSTQTLILASTPVAGSAPVSATTGQTINGLGTYRNLAASPTAKFTNVTFDNTLAAPAAAVTFNIGDVTLTGTATLTNGIIDIGNNNSFNFVSTASAVARTNGYVLIQGTGQMNKDFASGASSFTFHVGENTGTTEYSPFLLTFSANNTARTIGVKPVDATSANIDDVDVQTDYISRYWNLTNSAAGTYTYTAAATYVAADINGTEANMKMNVWNAASPWKQATSSAASNVLTITSGVTETTSPITTTSEFTGRVKGATTYTWNQTGTAAYGTAANWTPTRSTPASNDILIFDGATTPTPTVTGFATETIGKLLFTNSANVNLQSAATATLTISGGTGTDLDIPSGSTLNFSGTSTIGVAFSGTTTTSIAGTLTYSSTAGTPTLNLTNTVATVTGTINLSSTTAVTVTSTTSTLLMNGGSNMNITTGQTIIPIATWAATSTITFSGTGTSFTNNAQSFGNFIYNSSAITATLNFFTSSTVSIQGNFDIQATGTGKFRFVSTGSVTIGGNLTVSNAAVMDIASTTGSVTVTGNFTHSSTGSTTISAVTGATTPVLNIAGSFNISNGTVDLAASSSTTSFGTIKIGGAFNQIGGIITESGSSTTSVIEFNGSSSQAVTPIAANITNIVNFRVSNPAGIAITGTLPLNAGTTFTAASNGIAVTSGTVAYSTTTTLSYTTAVGAQTTGNEFPSTSGPVNLTINNTATTPANAVNLSADRTITGVLTLTAGKIILGANSLTLDVAATVSGTPSATKMVITDGAGQLKKVFATGASSFTFPVGENTGTIEYSPNTLTFTANDTQRTIGVKVIDATHPNINTGSTAVDYLSRYWSFTDNQAGTYTYTGTFTYVTGGVDVNGTEASIRVGFWNGSAWTQQTSTISSPTLTISAGLTETTGLLNGNDFTGRTTPNTLYTWTGGVNTDWATNGNWDIPGFPNLISHDVLINTAGGNQPIIATGATIATGALTINNASASLTLDGTATLTSGATITVTAGAINLNGSSVLTSGTSLSNSGTINVNGTSTLNITGALPTVGTLTSACGGTIAYNITGGLATLPAITYGNLTISGPAFASYSFPTGTTTICGNYSQSGGSVVNAANASGTYITNIGGTFTQAAGTTFNVTGTSATSGATVTVTGNTTIDGIFAMEANSSNTGSTVLFQANGNVSFSTSSTFDWMAGGSSGTTYNVTFGIKGNFAWNNTTDQPTTSGSGTSKGFTFNGTGTVGSPQTLTYNGTSSSPFYGGIYTVNTGTVVKLLTNCPIGASTVPFNNFTVNGTLDTNTFIVNGGATNGTFTLASGGTLRTANPNGVVSGTIGSISNSINTRTFNAAANYEFYGASLQSTGFPAAATPMNSLTINNSSNVSLNRNITVNGNLTFTTGNLDLNGSFNITLGASGSIVTETNTARLINSGSPSATNGYIGTTRTLGANPGNIGNIGLDISTASAMGSTVIKRFPKVVTSIPTALNSISRVYSIVPTTASSGSTIALSYFDGELNGNTETAPSLVTFSSTGANETVAANYSYTGASATDATANTVTFNAANLTTTNTFWTCLNTVKYYTANNGDWNTGSTWVGGAVPPANADVIINHLVSLSADSATVNSVTISSAKSVTVNSGFDLNVTDAVINNGTLTVQNNANLIQVNNVANSGSGATVVARNSSAIKRLDYTLWSSPVTGVGLYSFSPSTFANRFYVYRTNTNFYNNADIGFSITGLDPNGVNGTDSNSVPFTTAKGYLIRTPWNHPTTATVWNGSFSGALPNNGDISYSLAYNGAGFGFNLVGNPYPSPISMTTLVANNSSKITGTLYFWRETNNNTSNNAYCSWAGGTFTTNGEAQVFNPNGLIRTGQGFFVEALGASTTLDFKNGQRSSDNTGQFFRTTSDVENNRFWLNLTNEAGAFSQMAAGYMTDATDGVDIYDGKNINTGNVLLNSILNNTDYTIQGKALPFNAADVIPLSCKITDAGQYTITIDHVDGLFTGGAQAIYLRDILTGTEHDLQSGAYTFVSEAGTFNNRFEIIFQSQLGTPTFTVNSVIIYSQNNGFVVNSGNTVMSSIKVFDIRGRLIEEKENINASQTTIKGGLANEVLLVQITSEDGIVVTKKVIR